MGERGDGRNRADEGLGGHTVTDTDGSGNAEWGISHRLDPPLKWK